MATGETRDVYHIISHDNYAKVKPTKVTPLTRNKDEKMNESSDDPSCFEFNSIETKD